MPMPLDMLETELLNLSSVDRSHLLDRLVASLEADSQIAGAWALEAERKDAHPGRGPSATEGRLLAQQKVATQPVEDPQSRVARRCTQSM